MEMQQIMSVSGNATPLRGRNIDTDRIIPARYLKVIRFDTLGEFAFYDERFDKEGNALEHPLNDTRFQDSRILIVQSNFGSGSSREHAPQALMHYGFRAFVGESFAEIFQGNCLAMGLPVATLPTEEIHTLLNTIEATPKLHLKLDIKEQTLTVADGETVTHTYSVKIDEGARIALMNGSWDSTGSLLQNIDDIRDTARRIPYINNFQ